MDIKDKIKKLIRDTLKELDLSSFANSFDITHPKNTDFGDYSTNLVIRMGPVSQKSDEILKHLNKNKIPEIEKIDSKVGFINFYLSREFFTDSIKEILNKKENWGKNEVLKGKCVMVEYTQPNPFKPFHIGHLMSNTIGESISRIVEFSGAKTVRANYQGDVGPHVAKAIWGIMNSGKHYKGQSALWIGEQYAKGSDAYESDPKVKTEIDAINKKVYDKNDEKINEVYDWGKKVTLDAFEEIYKTLGTKFDYYFFESEMAPIGEKIVRENIGRVFEESEGAIVFHAEKYDPKLHTRVFITSLGIPLYETKEVGLTVTKFKKENPDISIITTAIEQGEYMKVVQKAVSLIHPDYESRMKHITHGMMRLTTGKMASRKGNVVTGESLLADSMDIVREKVAGRELDEKEKEDIAVIVGVAALKYSILRSNIGGDIVYDFAKSISFEGDSGPYLQYTAVRANAILNKANREGLEPSIPSTYEEEGAGGEVMEKLLYQFPEIVERAYQELEPHHIATYLTELASAFNSFYANTQIINKDDPNSPYSIALVESFYQTMKNGLYLLGIKTPEKM